MNDLNYGNILKSEIEEEYSKRKLLYRGIKRGSDILFSILGLVCLSPILLIIAILIKVDSKGPIIFSQTRVGYKGKNFKMYKFRSMVKDAEVLKSDLESKNEMSGPMFKMKKDPRITRIGRFLRKTSIDEIPQLLNVIKGDMSLVGPRPSLPNEVCQFDDWMLKRLEVKPGLTCFWQVSGRNDIEFEEWMKLDIKYVEERSLLVDVKLILRTFLVLFGDEHAR